MYDYDDRTFPGQEAKDSTATFSSSYFASDFINTKDKITVVHSTQEQDSRLQNLFHKVQNYSMTHPRRDGEFMTVLHQEQQ